MYLISKMQDKHQTTAELFNHNASQGFIAIWGFEKVGWHALKQDSLKAILF